MAYKYKCMTCGDSHDAQAGCLVEDVRVTGCECACVSVWWMNGEPLYKIFSRLCPLRAVVVQSTSMSSLSDAAFDNVIGLLEQKFFPKYLCWWNPFHKVLFPSDVFQYLQKYLLRQAYLLFNWSQLDYLKYTVAGMLLQVNYIVVLRVSATRTDKLIGSFLRSVQ